MKAIILLIALIISQSAKADVWLTTSLYTTHFQSYYDFNNDQNLIGIEAESVKGWFIQLSHFDNSYYGRSNSIMAGGAHRWSRYFGARYALGLANGYKDDYNVYNCGFETCKPVYTRAMLGKYKVIGAISAYAKFEIVRAEILFLGNEAVMVTASLLLF